MLLNDLLNEYLFHIQVQSYSPRTQKGYKNNNKAFLKYLENEFDVNELEEVKSLHIKQYGLYLIKKGRKETYVNSIYKNIRSFFNYCVEEGYLLQKQNPCLSVKWLREETPVIEAFTQTEVRGMVNSFKMSTYMEARNKLIIMFFADTGVRNTELCQLLQSNIGETTIKIIGKGRKERHLPISPVLNKYLLRYRRIRDQHFLNDFNGYDNLFLSFRGKPLTVEAMQRIIRIAGERANVTRDIRISPHTHYVILMLK